MRLHIRRLLGRAAGRHRAGDDPGEIGRWVLAGQWRWIGGGNGSESEVIPGMQTPDSMRPFGDVSEMDEHLDLLTARIVAGDQEGVAEGVAVQALGRGNMGGCWARGGESAI